MTSGRTPFSRTPEKDELFFGALAKGLSVSGACAVAGYSRSFVYEERGKDAEFAAAWDDAEESGTDVLEDEARRRAHDGTDEPVYQGGELVGTIRKYSDTLTIFLLKGRRPEKYRDNQNLTVKGGLTLEGLVTAAHKVADDEP